MEKRELEVTVREYCEKCNQLQLDVDTRTRKYSHLFDDNHRRLRSCRACHEQDGENNRSAAEEHYDWYC